MHSGWLSSPHLHPEESEAEDEDDDEVLSSTGGAWHSKAWSWAFGDTSITSKWWWNLAPRGCATMGCMILRAIDVWFKMVDTLKGDKHAEHQSSFTLAITQPPNRPAIACLLAYNELPAMSKLWSPWSTNCGGNFWKWQGIDSKGYSTFPVSLLFSKQLTEDFHEAIGMRFFTWNTVSI